MREATASWLNPMMEAAERELPEGAFYECMRQAMMPAAESDSPLVEAEASLARSAGITTGLFAGDWVRVGQLLRDRLGWDHYPEYPPQG